MAFYVRGLLVAGLLMVATGVNGADDTLYVCVEAGEGCAFSGATALQDAVDAATPGARIIVRAGRYHPQAHRDVPFSDEGESLSVRGFVVLDGKDLTITGESGAVIDGSMGLYASAFVARGSNLHIQGLEIIGFRALEKEDNIYDGHGIFLIDSMVSIDDVTIQDVEKMALTGRGNSHLTVRGLRILDSHLGIWLEEDAVLRLEGAHVENSESAGVAAYDRTQTVISNSQFVGNEDDGLYATGAARICVENSTIAGNRPYGVRAVEKGQIRVGRSVLSGNESTAIGAQIHVDGAAEWLSCR
ncbi:right-handed parallel beta-helix repeat-containing protein [Kordiimonas lacus]|uniref:Right handed beta helix region n=1 Tax=Kordiimonas lacus TaxID=637679 RepID=A0A1G7FDF0_9PROT|nr:right-handed parallel beta-helix repeat-containing protein [Kordiimonas lacus]SDE73978.1 Right handed beta helix region [Kordiimonas lacus]